MESGATVVAATYMNANDDAIELAKAMRGFCKFIISPMEGSIRYCALQSKYKAS